MRDSSVIMEWYFPKINYYVSHNINQQFDSNLAGHIFSTIEYTGFPQGIAHYMAKSKSNANRVILISKIA